MSAASPVKRPNRKPVPPPVRQERARGLYARLRAAGRCVDCKAAPAAEGRSRCERCRTWRTSDEFRASQAAWKLAHKQKRIAAGLCARCGEPAALTRTECQKHLDEALARRRAGRDAVIEAYGRACKCCGELREEFLTVGHINGDGAAERRSGLKGAKFYRWLRVNGFPPQYRLLCMNCNFSLGKRGYCPHASER